MEKTPLTIEAIKKMTSQQIADRIIEVRQVLQNEKQIKEDLEGEN